MESNMPDVPDSERAEKLVRLTEKYGPVEAEVTLKDVARMKGLKGEDARLALRDLMSSRLRAESEHLEILEGLTEHSEPGATARPPSPLPEE